PGYSAAFRWCSPRWRLCWTRLPEGAMRCPRCDSPEVTRLPASRISPHTGYVCGGCGLKMRARGLGFVYLVVFLLGAGMASGMAYGFVSGAGARPLKALYLAGLGFVAALYAPPQLLNPTPRREPSADG